MKLIDVADLIMGQSPPSESYNEVGDGLPFYQGKSDFGATYPTPRVYCCEPLRFAEAGDILMSVRAPVGATNLCKERSCIGRGITAIRPREIDRDFLYYNLKHIEPYLDSLGSGAIFKAINKHQLSQAEVNEVGFDSQEQKRIAQVLSTVQQAIEQQERLIRTTTELKQALMQKLFTEGLLGEKQKETEIGLVPESWEVVKLGSLAHIGNGSTPRRTTDEYWNGGTIPWLNSSKIHEVFITEADQYVTDMAVKECHLPKVPVDSLLIAITGQGKTLGNVAITRIETCINQHMAYVRFNGDTVVPEYLLWYLSTRYEFLRSIANGAGSTKGAITCGYLKTLPVPVPSREEQEEIRMAFNQIEQKLTNARAKVTALNDLFRTLLHELMTGKVRVNQEVTN